jgi:hypothetical protein
MIVKEFYLLREDGVKLYKTFSDENFYIKKIDSDELYVSAIDVEGSNYTYEETTTKIPNENEIAMLSSLD